METGFVKAMDLKAMLLGLVVLLVGVGIALIGVFEIFTLAIRGIALPIWVMYVAGGIIGLIGLVVLIVSANSTKCPKCGKLSGSQDAYFPLEQLETVVEAVENNRPEALVDMPKVPKNQMKTELEVNYCTGCGEIANVKVGKWEDSQPHDVLPPRQATGAQAIKYREVVLAHVEWRGDNEDD